MTKFTLDYLLLCKIKTYFCCIFHSSHSVINSITSKETQQK